MYKKGLAADLAYLVLSAVIILLGRTTLNSFTSRTTWIICNTCHSTGENRHVTRTLWNSLPANIHSLGLPWQ